MHELFPIVSGLLLAVLPTIRPQRRLNVGVGASVALGTLAARQGSTPDSSTGNVGFRCARDG